MINPALIDIPQINEADEAIEILLSGFSLGKSSDISWVTGGAFLIYNQTLANVSVGFHGGYIRVSNVTFL